MKLSSITNLNEQKLTHCNPIHDRLIRLRIVLVEDGKTFHRSRSHNWKEGIILRGILKLLSEDIDHWDNFVEKWYPLLRQTQCRTKEVLQK
jgi:hypothetical protein